VCVFYGFYILPNKENKRKDFISFYQTGKKTPKIKEKRSYLSVLIHI